MNESPFLILLMIIAGAYVARLWWSDLVAYRQESSANTQVLPGATPASRRSLWIAAGGSILILAGETLGELGLGLSEEQSEVTVLFGVYTLVAAVIEEIIFRGYIVVTNKGRGALFAGIFGASFLFALLHPFLWTCDMGESPDWQIVMVWRWAEWFDLTLTPKGWFSFAAVFVSSLWFYTCRFASWNPQQSLLPCFVGHGVKNLGVFLIKLAQGFVVGWW